MNAGLKIFCDGIDQTALRQIRALVKCGAYGDSRIRIIPDVHTGFDCTTGTTMILTDRVTPKLVGYKPAEPIVAQIGPTEAVENVVRPVYNYKAQ